MAEDEAAAKTRGAAAQEARAPVRRQQAVSKAAVQKPHVPVVSVSRHHAHWLRWHALALVCAAHAWSTSTPHENVWRPLHASVTSVATVSKGASAVPATTARVPLPRVRVLRVGCCSVRLLGSGRERCSAEKKQFHGTGESTRGSIASPTRTGTAMRGPVRPSKVHV